MERTRERGKNFKDTEVQLLLDLVMKHKDTIECKKTDMVSAKEKDTTWEVIAEEYNRSSGIYHRDPKMLRAKYENLKKVTKKKFAQERKYVMGTGGGPPIKSEITEIEYKVKDIIGDLAVLGHVSQFDSDSVTAQQEVEFARPESSSPWDFTNCPVVLEEEIAEETQMFKPPRNERFEGYALANHEAQILDVEPLSPTPTSSGCFNVQNSPRKLEMSTPVRQPVASKLFNVKELRSKTSTPLSITRKKKSLIDSSIAGKKIEVISEAKKEVMDIQKELNKRQLELMEEEYATILRFMKEEHEKKQTLLDLKIEKEKLKINLLKKGQ